MATQIICDKCEEIISSKSYDCVIGEFRADLCMQCAAEVQNYIESGSNA